MVNVRAAQGVLAAVVVALLVAGCTPAQSTPASPTPSASSAAPDRVDDVVTPTPTATIPVSQNEHATFLAVVDGDTVETSAGIVRLIGIDTPERGECGADAASSTIWRVVTAGDSILLELPPGQNDRDRHGRLVRFVTTESGIDLGLLQLEEGNAIARYDSFDGYPRHPREAEYHAAQLATRSDAGGVLTVSCAAPPLTTLPPATADPSEGDPWWMAYSSCTRLKRNTAGHPTGPFDRDNPAEAEIYQWFAFGTGNRGDGDGDGLACE